MRLSASLLRGVALFIAVGAGRFSVADEVKPADPIYIKFQAEDFGGAAGDQPQWHPGWLSVSAKADAQSGELLLDFIVPQSGKYLAWVRHVDVVGKAEPFDVVVDYPGGQARALFGRADVGGAKAAFRSRYVWASQPMVLTKGQARIRIVLPSAAQVSRSLDNLVLTTDASWTPHDRGFPPLAYSQYLTTWAKTRKRLPSLLPSPHVATELWTLPRSHGRDFWYLGAGELAPGFPIPVHIQGEASTVPSFVANYRAAPASAPIFSSPLCGLKLSIGEVKKLLDPTDPLRKHILEHKVPFVVVGNYGTAGKVADSYAKMKDTFGPLWLGIISGEGSYLDLPTYDLSIPLGPQFKELQYQWLLTQAPAVWRTKLGADWASPISNPFEKFIFCPSVGTLHNIHRFGEAGCPILGTESAAAMAYMQQQIAFARGAARQYGCQWMWYYGASFGSAIRTFTKESPYIIGTVDNRNDVVGPSLAHIRRVLLHTYLQGASFFFPEQGYNLIGPDGRLNPMGWCYDEMVRLATRHPERGVTYAPVAVLLDRAHGWEKYGYVGSRIWNKAPMAPADRMIDEFFNVAYYPFPRNEGEQITDLNVCWPNGYFGDIFDVLVTSPTRLDAIRKYPVVFCVGDTRLDPRWAAALKEYVAAGGTLVINAEQVVPPLDESFLGAKLLQTSKEASSVKCLPDGEILSSTPFSYREAKPGTGRVIAATDSGDPVAMLNAVAKGRVILTTPAYLLGLDMAPTPYMARLLLQVTQELLPVTIRGNCEHYVNLHPKGYVVVLSHNEGIAKLSHSPATMDRGNSSTIKLRIAAKPIKTEDWLGEEPQKWTFPNEWLPEYTEPMKVSWQKDGDGYTASVTLRPGEIRCFFVQTHE